MRDYSDKRVARESIERKPVAKNRPRRESNGMFVLLSVLVLFGTFGAGVGTGWIASKKLAKPAAVAVAQTVKKEDPTPVAVAPKADAPLTFYKTLSAGGKGAMGTGLNLKKPEPAPTAPQHPQHPAPAVVPAADPVPAATGSADSASAAPTASATLESATRFVVQVASYREKQEAVTAQAKLAGKGVAAYLVESRVADKGIWYRLRVGRHLTKTEAGELAGKSGKGAIVLPE